MIIRIEMLQLRDVLGAGFDGLPYHEAMPLGQYLREVVAEVVGVAPARKNTVRVHVQTYGDEVVTVFNDENCDMRLGEVINDGGTLFYSLTAFEDEDVEGNAGTAPMARCAVCFGKMTKDTITLLCSHTFHAKCLNAWLQTQRGAARCITCRVNICMEDEEACKWMCRT